jgi:hypothetical protein
VFIIPDENVQRAFDIMHSGDHAKARAAYSYLEKRLKVVLSQAQARSNAKTIAEREGEALRSVEYEDALLALREVEREYHEAKDARDAARAVIDAWRTQQSDLRAMGRVG